MLLPGAEIGIIAFLLLQSMAHSFIYRQDGFELSFFVSDAKIRKYEVSGLWFHSKCAFLQLSYKDFVL
jgi:hypothetical protein